MAEGTVPMGYIANLDDLRLERMHCSEALRSSAATAFASIMVIA
jgi:hypothetical protein